ncbi:MAG: hypothetical protein LBU64_03945 [Planctomycetota bacterium]|jgi:hypothetical protein|nr:hypothetical protein [Planctomycetota bacterium]
MRAGPFRKTVFAAEAIHLRGGFLPINNLLAAWPGRREPESGFASAFAQAYRRRHRHIHSGTRKCATLFVREVPVSGYGIADLLVLSWDAAPPVGEAGDLDRARPTIRAFEMKISDWRLGLTQAHRYGYYANASILVVPKTVLPRAAANLPLFRNARVGLWGFNPLGKGITRVYTPRPKAINPGREAHIRAIKAAREAAISS